MTTTTEGKFAVFANGAFWGAFPGADEAAAIQAAADEHGTDGNTEGMTATPLRAAVLDIQAGCASNGVDARDVIREFFNCRDAEIHKDGDVWIVGPYSGNWVDAEGLEAFIAWELGRQ